ncbi:hypothetical protein ACJIZ3_024800 [Penstemon smallii]|uniref:Uncharacterized protein n=1 Tax=Penstemon smallii TaxID=265156 RepID=A0ABD3TSW1_9LAMI
MGAVPSRIERKWAVPSRVERKKEKGEVECTALKGERGSGGAAAAEERGTGRRRGMGGGCLILK